MAAYAAVTSLIGTIHLISQSNLYLQEGHKEHLKLLNEKLSSLQKLLENIDDEPTRDLQERVKDVAHEAEDQVESQVHLLMEKDKHVRKAASKSLLLRILRRATENIDSVQKELFEQRKNNNVQQAVNCSLGGSISPRSHDSTLENDMVGYGSEQEHIRGQLTGHSSQLEVISIAGMGGIGKSTFAKKMFSEPSIVDFFDVRGWITVSKDYSIRKMLLSLLQDTTGEKQERDQKSYDATMVNEKRDQKSHDVIVVNGKRGEKNDDAIVVNTKRDQKSNGVIVVNEKRNKRSDDTTGVIKKRDQNSDAALADRLQKSLKGRRYLIVVDDIWSTKAWDEIRLWFPEYNNRSRILLTTRDMKVAQYASSPKDPFPMRPLEPKESWNLFCQKAFGKKDCPTEFENVAKVVVQYCKGLPLTISVVAGALSSKKTLDGWRRIAQSVSSLVNLDDYQRCLGVLALSYNHLPSHLKACFLYFGLFPKANEISVKKLTRLWAAEGFLELREFEGLEKVAVNMLQDLIDKSLVVVSKRSLDGKIKTCGIHDLLHDLCLRESESENLLYVVNPSISGRPKRIYPQGRRWISILSKREGPSSNTLFDDLTDSRIRSIHYSFVEERRFTSGSVHFKLVRVLDLETMRLGSFPTELVHLVSLRYLAVRVFGFPSHLQISKLWNLQTFIFRQYTTLFSGSTISLPNGIWEMSQLRHLHSTGMCLYSPPKKSANNDVKNHVSAEAYGGISTLHGVLENLQSVSGLSLHCCTKEILEGIKKVKKLGIKGEKEKSDRGSRCLEDLTYLHELEALDIATYHRIPCPSNFPPNLKKLTLSGTHLLWSNMTIISSLPKLEVLQLKAYAFEGAEWEISKMEFPELKFLLLEKLDLDYWRAGDDSFPCLERIIISNCRRLKEIPEGFADSMTLQLIELKRCTPSLVTFAEQIQKEQLEILGNNMLKIHAFDTIRVSGSDVGDEQTVEDDI